MKGFRWLYNCINWLIFLGFGLFLRQFQSAVAADMPDDGIAVRSCQVYIHGWGNNCSHFKRPITLTPTIITEPVGGFETRIHLLIETSLIARFMGPTWGPSGADRTQVGPMLIPWILLSGLYWIPTKSLDPKASEQEGQLLKQLNLTFTRHLLCETEKEIIKKKKN